MSKDTFVCILLALALTVLVGCGTLSPHGSPARTQAQAAMQTQGQPRRPEQATRYGDRSGKVYSADECAGPVVAGVCHGGIVPKDAYHPTCYGAWVAGKCTGPQF